MALNLFKYFTPQDRKFFPLFDRLSDNLVTIAKHLVDLLHASPGERRKELITEIERLEHIADTITREALVELSSNFITPFDREDIHNLLTTLADATGFIYNSSKKISLYKVKKISPEMIKLGDLVYKGAENIQIAIKELKDVRNHKQMEQSIMKINTIESEADFVFELGIGKLFDEETDPIQLIKYKDILQMLEVATDKNEEVADVLETIMIKNA